jgi:two-component system chemotaxis response regulator CheB
MPPRNRDVIVIGGSAGAVQALFKLLGQLPRGLEAAVAVTLHRHPTFASSLAGLFSRRSNIEVVEPYDGQRFEPGLVYLAPPDRHMMVHDDVIALSRAPRQHHTRPAIDPLFTSAAESCGDRVVGALLTGNLSDGVTGLIHIKALGGLSLVQDPDEAPYPSMPRNALIYDHVDLVFQIDLLASVLVDLVRGTSIDDVARLGARPVEPSDLTAVGDRSPGRSQA